MPDNDTGVNRKYWNDQHTLLRRLLDKGQDFQKAIELFLSHHAMVHAAKLQGVGGASFQDEILQGLTDRQMRAIPPGHANSIVWMLWHITRIEDATMNVLLADEPQVFHRGNWQSKVNSPYTDVGNEMSTKEIHALSEAVNVKALLDYRLAVGGRTRQIMEQIKAETLKEKPFPARLKRLAEDGTVRVQANWLLDYWGRHPQANLLFMPATRHSFVHLNEMGRMLPALRRLQDK